MANKYLGNFNLIDKDTRDVLNQNVATPPIKNNLSDMSDEDLLSEYQKIKMRPEEQQAIADAQKQQRERELFNNLSMIGEKLGRAIGKTSQPTDKDFYEKLTQSGQEQTNQQLANIQRGIKERELEFKNLSDIRKEAKERKKDEAYLKIQQDQEERAKERFANDKQMSEIELNKARITNQAEIDKNDPNSQLSKTKYVALSTQYPKMKDLMQGKSFNELSILAEGIGGKIKRDDEMYNRQQDREVKRQAQEILNFNKQQALEEKTTSREIKSQEKLDKQVTNYKDALTKAGIPDAVATLDEIDNLLPDQGKDIPGYGLTAVAPDWAVSKQGKDLRQIVNKLFNITLKQRSGAAVTDPELQRLKDEFGSGKMKTDDQLRKGIQDYKKILANVIKNNEAGYRPEVRQQYMQNEGLSFMDKANEYLGPQSQKKYDFAIEQGIENFAKVNNLSREDAIKELKKAGKLK